MKVALVLLPSWRRETPSLGIAYLASSLTGCTVERFEFNLTVNKPEWIDRISDFNNNKDIDIADYVEYCVSEIRNCSPRIVAFSVYDCNFRLSLAVAKKLKTFGISMIFGGPQMFSDKNAKIALEEGVDYIVQGEGDVILPKIIKGRAEQVPGVAFLKNGRFFKTKMSLADDIDSFHYPEFRKADILVSEVPWMLPIILGRGCIGTCDFCFEKKFWERFRSRSAAEVIKEIRYQKVKHKINCFRFNDCAINNDMSGLMEFCESVNLNIKWGGNFRIDRRFSLGEFKTMYSSGCRFLTIGAESGSDRVLKDMRKGYTSKDILNNIANAHRAGIWVHLYLIVGYPTESNHDFAKTIRLIHDHENHIDSFDVSAFTIVDEADIAKSSTNRLFDQKTALDRKKTVDNIFTHKLGYPYSHMLEDDPIDFKKHQDSSRIITDIPLYDISQGHL